MPNGNIGRQLMGGVISKYVGEGGRMSGALGILDNLIKKREEERTFQKGITTQLLGVKEVARGVAQKRGLPFVESEEDIQAKKYRGLQITAAEQNLAGTSVGDAKTFAFKVLQSLESDITGIRLSKIDRSSFIENAKAKMLGSYNVLPPTDQQLFEDYAGSIWDKYASKEQKKVTTAKETVTTPKSTTADKWWLK